MTTPRRAVRNLRRLTDTAGRAAAAYGAGRVRTAVRAQRLRRRHGFDHDELLNLGLLDPAVPADAAAGHVSKHRALALQRRLNPQDLEALTENKVIFYRHCEALGIAVPALLGVVARGSAGWCSGRTVTDADDWRALVHDELPPEFVVKPALGYYGVGVRVLRRTGTGLVDASGRSQATDQVFRELQRDPDFSLFVVQERMHNGPELEHLGGGRALQTLRIVTFAERSGRVVPTVGLLKLALGDDAIDNFRGGATGNASVEVALDDGRLGPVMTARPDGCGFLASPVNPVTGARVEGQAIPGWHAICELVTDAARAFRPMRSIGWDVALTTRGPVIVEANAWWDPFGTGDRMRRVFSRMEADL
jgi:hypothetical protein